MDRASLFVLILLFMFVGMIIFEFASSDKQLTSGNYLASAKYTGSYEPIVEMTGEKLPPIQEYKDKLYKSLIGQIIDQLHDLDKETTSQIIKNFRKFYEKAFIRWIFDSNSRHELRVDLIPKCSPINHNEIKYWLADQPGDIEDMITLKYEIGTEVSTLRARVPIKARVLPVNEYEKFMSGLRDFDKRQFQHKVSQGMAILVNDNASRNTWLPISHLQAQRVHDLFTGPKELCIGAAWTALYVYHTLGGLGNNGSIPRGLIDDSWIELFGSPLNTQQRYCSPFAFEKTMFGSLGSFFDYRMMAGQKYTFNPPYSSDLMDNAGEHLVGELDRLGMGSNTTVTCVIPVWDTAGRRSLGEEVTIDEPYRILEILTESPYFKEKRVIKKNDHRFYSWYDNDYISYASTYLILLSTDKSNNNGGVDLDFMIERWKELSDIPRETVDDPTMVVHNLIAK